MYDSISLNFFSMRSVLDKVAEKIKMHVLSSINFSGNCAILCFHCNSDYTNVPQCYVIRTLLILSQLMLQEVESWRVSILVDTLN